MPSIAVGLTSTSSAAFSAVVVRRKKPKEKVNVRKKTSRKSGKKRKKAETKEKIALVALVCADQTGLTNRPTEDVHVIRRRVKEKSLFSHEGGRIG